MLRWLLLLYLCNVVSNELVSVTVRKNSASAVEAVVDTSRILALSIDEHLQSCTVSSIHLLSGRCSGKEGVLSCTRVNVVSAEEVVSVEDRDTILVTCQMLGFFSEDFDESSYARWMDSDLPGAWWRRSAAIRQSADPAWYLDKGLATTTAQQRHGLFTTFNPVSTGGKTFLVQFQLTVEGDVEGCSYGELTLYSHRCSDSSFEHYDLRFGLNVCSEENRTSLLLGFGHGVKTVNIYTDRPDSKPHFYTLVVHANSSFEVLVDFNPLAHGTLDPTVSRPDYLSSDVLWVPGQVFSDDGQAADSFALESISCLLLDAYQDFGAPLFFDKILFTRDSRVAQEQFWQAKQSLVRTAPFGAQAHVLDWYVQYVHTLSPHERFKYSTVLVHSLQQEVVHMTCAVITQEGHLLCNQHPSTFQPGAEDSAEASFAVAVNGPDAAQPASVVYLALTFLVDRETQLAVLKVKAQCCDHFEVVNPGNLPLPTTPYRSSGAEFQPGRAAIHLCMNDATHSKPTHLKATQITLEDFTQGVWVFFPAVDCSGGVVVDSEGVLLGMAATVQIASAEESSLTTSTLIPITAAMVVILLAERDANIDRLTSRSQAAAAA